MSVKKDLLTEEIVHRNIQLQGDNFLEIFDWPSRIFFISLSNVLLLRTMKLLSEITYGLQMGK